MFTLELKPTHLRKGKKKKKLKLSLDDYPSELFFFGHPSSDTAFDDGLYNGHDDDHHQVIRKIRSIT